MTVGFKFDKTKRIFDGSRSRHYPPEIQTIALRKLLLIDAATSVHDLRVPPGNRLEKLAGNSIRDGKAERHGQYSIRMNDQWRICFM